jgi:putative phosphoribosyl transferase
MRTHLDAPQPVRIPLGRIFVEADLHVPHRAIGLVIFAHGSGSSRHSARNRYVAEELTHHGFGTLLVDLLTPDEALEDEITSQYRFDIPRLGQRVVGVIDWIAMRPELQRLPIGLFGASTGAAAALVAAAERPLVVRTVVSRGGRPDLADRALDEVAAPALFLVGSKDVDVITLNNQAAARMNPHVEIELVPGATHLFEEPGTLEHVASRAAGWFETYLPVHRPTSMSA